MGGRLSTSVAVYTTANPVEIKLSPEWLFTSRATAEDVKAIVNKYTGEPNNSLTCELLRSDLNNYMTMLLVNAEANRMTLYQYITKLNEEAKND